MSAFPTFTTIARQERGFTIIEVLVSAVLLAVVSLGLFTAFDSATKASGINKARTVAAQIAQTDQERLRAKTGSELVTLNGTPETTTKTVDGRVFTITSTATWVSDPSTTTSCGGLGKEAGYQQISSSVTWPDRGSTGPVVSRSLKAVPNGGFDSTRGSLAMTLINAAGTGTSGVTVSISGPTSATATTNASGCALFGFIPPGTYAVTVNQAGYVRDKLPNDQSFAKSVTVVGGQTSSTSLIYDQAASLGVAFYTRDPSSSTDSTTKGDGFTVANGGLSSPYFKPFAGLNPTNLTGATGASNAAVPVANAQKVLFPFSGGYSVWAGTCADNDPTAAVSNTTNTNGPNSNGTVATAPGAAVTNVKVIEPMLKITVKRYTTSAQTASSSTTTQQAARVIILPTTPGCTSPVTVDTTATGTIATASQPTLPYGSYSVCVQDKTSSPTKRATATLVNNVRNGQNVTLYLPFATTNPAACPTS